MSWYLIWCLGLGWATHWLDTVLNNIFSHNPLGFGDSSLLQVGGHISTWSIFDVYNCKVCGPHSQATATATLKTCKNFVTVLLFCALSCHTPLTTPHLIVKRWQQLAPLLGVYKFVHNSLGLVGTSWECWTPGIV